MGFRHRSARTWPVAQAGIMPTSAVDPPGASNRSGRLERSRRLRPSGSDIETASGEPCVVFGVLGHVHEFPNRSCAEKARSRIGPLPAPCSEMARVRAWQGPSTFRWREASGPALGAGTVSRLLLNGIILDHAGIQLKATRDSAPIRRRGDWWGVLLSGTKRKGRPPERVQGVLDRETKNEECLF